MRLAAILTLSFLAGIASAQTPAPTPQPTPKASLLQRPEITVAQAEKDSQAGLYRFYTYGMISMAHTKAAGILKKEYNIQISGAAGCVVTRDLVNRVRAYNEIMDKAVFKKYGKTYSQLLEEARQKVQSDQPGTPPTR